MIITNVSHIYCAHICTWMYVHDSLAAYVAETQMRCRVYLSRIIYLSLERTNVNEHKRLDVLAIYCHK